MSNSVDAALLVVGLYTHDELLAHAATTFEGYELFNTYSEPGYALLWECVWKTWETVGVKPTPFMLLPQAQALLPTLDFSVSQLAATQIACALDIMWKVENPVGREHTQKLLESAGRRAAVDKLLQVNALEDNSVGALIEHVDGIQHVLNSVTPNRGVRKRPLAQSERTRLLRVRPRWKWGIDYWDNAELSWYKKEIHGLLGPTGGGKTVNMTNIATRQLKAGRKVIVALYEQALEEDVTQRIISNLSGVSMNELRDKDEADIDPKAKARIDAACDAYVQNLVVFDMIGEAAGDGGVAELKAQIEEERLDTGFEPDLIIVDWLGEMVQRYRDLGSTDAAYRRTCEKFMADIVQYKEDTGYSFLILHQTNTHAQGLSCVSKPNKTMAHEFRSFANRCDTCSVLGTMDRSLQVCWFIPDKSRRSCSRDRLVQLNGEYMRFADVSNRYEPMNNIFVEISAAQEARDAASDRIRGEGWMPDA